ncbi:MAG TPA: vitamin B12 dependent-methionine synthase activation domain-containing protein, partial [Elusimicrobiota bacterium]|nr:vitamin B12 dependent-methionine synthase activation domain-containing protein [Elusimicrobiota bacterium]
DLLKKNEEIQNRLRAAGLAPRTPAAGGGNGVSKVNRRYEPPTPPDLKLHVLSDFHVDDIYKYLNPVMLYGKHLGLRGTLQKQLDRGDEKAVKLHKTVTELQSEIVARKLIAPKAVWRFFPAQAEGDRTVIYESLRGGPPIARFDFPRQSAGDRLCLSDFVLPASDGKMDYVALFVVTCGQGILELSREWREKGDYLKSHALQAIAIESAEALAELLHDRIRSMWGIGDPKDMTLQQKLQTKYRGIRVSFGYPACPNLEDQAQLFALLDPAKHIGVGLTENFMMEPEASVSALVFHHPEARYFSVLGEETAVS